MTNQELRDYFKEEIKEVKDELREMRAEHKVMHRDFYLFKGKALGFITVISVVVGIGFDVIKKKLGL